MQSYLVFEYVKSASITYRGSHGFLTIERTIPSEVGASKVHQEKDTVFTGGFLRLMHPFPNCIVLVELS